MKKRRQESREKIQIASVKMIKMIIQIMLAEGRIKERGKGTDDDDDYGYRKRHKKGLKSLSYLPTYASLRSKPRRLCCLVT